MSLLFFKESKSATKQITELFDFIWPTVAGMWNLRRQIEDYLSVKTDVSQDELYQKFILGSGIHSINFRSSFIETTWKDQEGNFANILLTNIFAIYESWISEILKILTPSGIKKRDLVKDMQFPSTSSEGVWQAINTICLTESDMLKNAFYSKLTSNKKNSKIQLDNLMKCYRYFKECRNCIIHNGGLANNNLVQACNEFTTIANTSDLGIREVPKYNKFSLNDKIKLDLRGVVGFCDIVIRIITTCDAELSRSILAENEFKKLWETKGQKGRTLKTDPEKKRIQIKRYVVKLDYPEPVVTDKIEEFILKNKFVSL